MFDDFSDLPKGIAAGEEEQASYEVAKEVMLTWVDESLVFQRGI